MIHVCEPLIGSEEMKNVVDCLQTNWISSKGRYIEEFEQKFAAYCGCKYGIATTSGTTALHLALVAAGIGPGDEVIMPAFTMIATAFAIIYTGATPVLVDAEPEYWNIDVRRIEEKITGKTRAIMPVHIYGHPCDMDELLELAKKHNLYVIEDAAEAHGAEYHGKRTGGLGRIGCFSFYANKIITTGEGGMVVTSDPEIAAKSRSFKDLAYSPTKRFLHVGVGFNYRMTNVQAAIGLAQFGNIDRYVEARRQHARTYNRLLGDIPGLTLPREKEGVKNVYWMYGVVVEKEFGMSRDELQKKLEEKGIETRTFFFPMNQQPIFHERGLFRGETHPVAEALGRKGLYLPSSTGLTDKEMETVCQAIRDIRGKR